MQAGVGGKSSSGTSTTTTPFAPYLQNLLPTLFSGTQSLAQGQGVKTGLQNITNYVKQTMNTGVQNMKTAFAGSGMAQSSDLMRGISQYQQQSTTDLAAQLSQYQMQFQQNQLAALGEIIAMGQGIQTTSQQQSSFGWNVGMNIAGGQNFNPAG